MTVNELRTDGGCVAMQWVVGGGGTFVTLKNNSVDGDEEPAAVDVQ